MEIINYHSCVEEGLDNAVEFTDKIGQGMEIKETPILRYNGINYKVAKSQKTVTLPPMYMKEKFHRQQMEMTM